MPVLPHSKSVPDCYGEGLEELVHWLIFGSAQKSLCNIILLVYFFKYCCRHGAHYPLFSVGEKYAELDPEEEQKKEFRLIDTDSTGKVWTWLVELTVSEQLSNILDVYARS